MKFVLNIAQIQNGGTINFVWRISNLCFSIKLYFNIIQYIPAIIIRGESKYIKKNIFVYRNKECARYFETSLSCLLHYFRVYRTKFD